MQIDNKLEQALDQLRASADADVGQEIIKIAIKATPYLGSAIDKLMSGAGQRRLIQRIVEVFEEVKLQLEEVDEKQIDQDYFLTEEFQTLLALVLQEIQTTHDKTKLRMLAAALSNSSQTKFQTEMRKELFVRTLRTLSPDHIQMLDSLVPTYITREEFDRVESRLSFKQLVNEEGYSLEDLALHRVHAWRLGSLKVFPLAQSPRGEQLLLLQNLAGHGLVEEMLGPKAPPSKIDFEKFVRSSKTSPRRELPSPPTRCFRLSTFGEQFLAFVSSGKME